MAQGPSSSLLECAENEWYVVRRPYDESSMSCSAECPGDWLTTTSDGLNWCFEPAPATESLLPAPEDQEQKNGQPQIEEAVTAAPTRRTPVWVFGVGAVAAVFVLSAVMSSRKYEQTW